jgi:uncharacterized protein (TIGR00297 family)
VFHALASTIATATTTPARAALGLVLAAGVALAARRARALGPGGAVAATAVGAASVAAGWDWAPLLMVFFVGSTAWSRVGRDAKAARTGAIVEKGDERDAYQVLANGGLFALAAVAFAIGGSPTMQPLTQALAGGSLAAATADTWATEVGTWVGGRPRSILSFRRVAAGTSGGVTAAGTLAALAGATSIAATAALLGWPRVVAAWILVGGFAGAIADSVLGATLQARRWCAVCNQGTERHVHSCGRPTKRAGGVHWLDNDGVNALCGIVGALVSVAGSRYAGVA